MQTGYVTQLCSSVDVYLNDIECIKLELADEEKEIWTAYTEESFFEWKDRSGMTVKPGFDISVILDYKREIDTQTPDLGINFPFVNLKWLKIANFAGLYYPHFTTFRNETLEYY